MCSELRGEVVSSRLGGKTAVVTGASGGIGRAISLALAREGAHVAIHYNRSRASAEKLAEEIRALGRRGVILQADVGDPAAAERLAQDALRELERIDVWMNVAGADILTGSGAQLSDLEKLERVMSVDLRGTVLCSWAVGEIMIRQGGGVIINISWDHDPLGAPTRVAEAFSATKGGIEAFSKNLALRLAPHVRVNVIAPGWIETTYGEGLNRVFYARVADSMPLKRWGRPEDVAGAALFLASDESAYITGQTIRVNGGKVR
jgi:3-oxoacyl-[acyl-carrier protein] reductase